MFTVGEMLCSSAQDPKDVVRKGMLSSLPWEPGGERATVLVRLWRWRAITAVLAIEDYSRAGKQEVSHTRDTRFLPHLRLILPPSPSSTPDTGSR